MLLFLFFLGNAQSPTQCLNATPICNNYTFSITPTVVGTGLTPSLNISNPNVNPQGVNDGCQQASSPKPSWFSFTVTNSGNLGFSFSDSTTAFPQIGFYDWTLWSLTPSTCNDIFNNILPPVACNWNGKNSGGTGLYPIPQGGDSLNYQPSFTVTAGQQFVLLFSNYSGVNTQVVFRSTGTASINCGGIPTGLDGNNSANANVVIFPNPVSDKLNLTFAKAQTRDIQVISPEGKILYNSQIKSESFNINSDFLSRGIYFLKIEEGIKSSWYKIIKE